MKPSGRDVLIYISVVANAKKNEIIGPYNKSLKVKIHSPPVDGKANKEIIKFFSSVLDVAKSRISIVRGELSNQKVLQVLDCDTEFVVNKIAFIKI